MPGVQGGGLDGIDLDNPCEVWPVLRRSYLELAAGAGVSQARYGEDSTSFSRADMGRLDRLWRELKADCEARTAGVKRRRRAITAGFR